MFFWSKRIIESLQIQGQGRESLRIWNTPQTPCDIWRSSSVMEVWASKDEALSSSHSTSKKENKIIQAGRGHDIYYGLNKFLKVQCCKLSPAQQCREGDLIRSDRVGELCPHEWVDGIIRGVGLLWKPGQPLPASMHFQSLALPPSAGGTAAHSFPQTLSICWRRALLLLHCQNWVTLISLLYQLPSLHSFVVVQNRFNANHRNNLWLHF